MAATKGRKQAKSATSEGGTSASKKTARPPQGEGKKAGTRVSTLGDYRSTGKASGKGGGKAGSKGGGSGNKLRDGSK